MNEGTKTGIFWCIAVVMLAIAALVAWPTSTDPTGVVAGTDLFDKFTDPQAAASLKIVTFDEEQGQLETFEVRKDRENGLWKIPSRSGYPADATKQMTDAANAFVGLKILDVQTDNAEDHDDLGVAEPKLEDLEIGDEGVGRLVTFKDESQQTLASLIIGDPTKDDPEKLYVRIPGQDPVYVVRFDESPLTTKFQSWIEDDLLQLSSIEVDEIEIKDYSVSMNLNGRITPSRNYDAKFTLDGSDWTLASLMEYDPKNPVSAPTPVAPNEDDKVNKTKIDEIKNALDDLKIADVLRKPDGMSENLRADQDLLSDNEAVSSLARRGFYPIQRGSDYEILSANGEMTVGLKNGVQYVLRFGDTAGLTSKDDSVSEQEDSVDGMNRYLLVMTQVDQSKFPAPQLKPVPQTLEDLEALLAPPMQVQPSEPAAAAVEKPGDQDEEIKKADDKPASNEKATAAPADPDANKSDAPKADKPDSKSATEAPKEAKPEEAKPEEAKPEDAKPEEAKPEDAKPEPAAPEKDQADEPAKQDSPEKESPKKDSDDEGAESEADGKSDPPQVEGSGETEGGGSGETTGSGEGQESSDADDQNPQDEKKPAAEQKAEKPTEPESPSTPAADGDNAKPDSGDDKPAAASETPAADGDTPAADGDKPAADGDKPAAVNELDELTDEEKQERLEAEQEKITKENQRKMDERKDKIEAAKKRVRALNERFADWYYVIPEDTYKKLRINRDELFEKPGAEGAVPPAGFGAPGSAGPSFQIPGAQFPGAPGN